MERCYWTGRSRETISFRPSQFSPEGRGEAWLWAPGRASSCLSGPGLVLSLSVKWSVRTQGWVQHRFDLPLKLQAGSSAGHLEPRKAGAIIAPAPCVLGLKNLGPLDVLQSSFSGTSFLSWYQSRLQAHILYHPCCPMFLFSASLLSCTLGNDIGPSAFNKYFWGFGAIWWTRQAHVHPWEGFHWGEEVGSGFSKHLWFHLHWGELNWEMGQY